jgi:hypothetical protein
MKQRGQGATAPAPLHKSTPPTPEAVGVVKSIEQLRSEADAAQTFAKWAQSADDDDAPALLFYPKPSGSGKGVWSWKQKAAHDAQALVAALKAAEASAAAEAAKPKLVPEDPEVMPEEESSYIVPEDTPEVVAARQARYAAEGRSSSGVLLAHPSPCYGSCCAPPKRAPWSDAECQAAVDLWGWRLGAELILEQNEGWSLDDLYGAEMQQAWDQYMLALRETEVQREAEGKASEAARWKACVVQQAMIEARRNLKRGQAVEKNGRICTRCYSCVGNKTTDWEDGGKKARPSTLHVSDVCFTHQAFLEGKIKDDCPFLHSGDQGWQKPWDTNFLWDPTHPEVMPVAKHIRMREGDYTTLCISEKSAGYLPIHLGGKAEGVDARQWRGSAQRQPQRAEPQRAEPQRQPQGRFAALAEPMMGGGSTPQRQPQRRGYTEDTMDQFEAAAAWEGRPWLL